MISKIIAAIGISLMIYGAPCAFAQGGDLSGQQALLEKQDLGLQAGRS
ncbi:MAG: hypothetical protein VYE69_18025 [Pseudomonadota bacterium]|jgi:hypothetical protein|nr:hypothetical protein [Roseibium aggregatum]MCR9283590.1 hypothetical protein [Paracoccaceae bacterium]MEC9470223.1 hypothetical protein [Pseudomonadota bacterium]MEE2867142.1 hypothetical protein [Pseudomonadota bacterium]QFT65893.1 hypothetical protein FIU93_03825 [Labrenzia sp. THAF35]